MLAALLPKQFLYLIAFVSGLCLGLYRFTHSKLKVGNPNQNNLEKHQKHSGNRAGESLDCIEGR